MTPLINSVAINDRPDWEHVETPGPPQGRRMIEFPGIPRYAVQQGPVMPWRLTLSGHLQGDGANLAAAHVALHAAMLALVAHASTPCTVTIPAGSYQHMLLVGLAPAGSMEPVEHPTGGARVIRPVRLEFQALRFPS